MTVLCHNVIVVLDLVRLVEAAKRAQHVGVDCPRPCEAQLVCSCGTAAECRSADGG